MALSATYAITFVVAMALDWVTALAIRYTAAESPMAVVFAVLLTGIWWFAVRAAIKGYGHLVMLLAGAAAGTFLGVSFP